MATKMTMQDPDPAGSEINWPPESLEKKPRTFAIFDEFCQKSIAGDIKALFIFCLLIFFTLTLQLFLFLQVFCQK